MDRTLDGNDGSDGEATEEVAQVLYDIGGMHELQKCLPPLQAETKTMPLKPISVVMGSNIDSILPNVIFSSVPAIPLHPRSC